MSVKKSSGKSGKSDKTTEQQPKARKSRVLKPKGPQPVSYAPKPGHEVKALSTEKMVHDVGQLLNDCFDREQYLVGDAVFKKTTRTRFKGSPDEILAVEFFGAVTGHKLLLSGVEPGTAIFNKDLAKPAYEPKGKSEAMNCARKAIYKYLREAKAEWDLADAIRQEESRVARETAAASAKASLVSEPDSTDLRNVWRGRKGIVASGGMRFRVTEESKDSHRFSVVYVIDAPYETELFGLDGSKTYVTVGQLHGEVFRSSLREGSKERETQKRVWTFFRKGFVEAGLLNPAPKKQERKEEQIVAHTPSSYDVEKFIPGFPGKYCFDKGQGVPKAFFLVESIDQHGKPVTVVRLVGVHKGHKLFDVCQQQIGTYLYHNMFRRDKMPEFKGDRAPALAAMWEFLSGVIADHRRKVLAQEFPGLTVSTEPLSVNLRNPLDSCEHHVPATVLPQPTVEASSVVH